MKCNRTVCTRTGIFRHSQNGQLYCPRCARKINEDNPGLIPWVVAYPIQVRDSWVKMAGTWHSGQASALYSVSSTGTIHDYPTQVQLECELRHAMKLSGGGELEFFYLWVEKLPAQEDE